MYILFKTGNEFVYRMIKFSRDIGRSGNDKRCPCLINEDGVNLINYGKVKIPLTIILDVKLHIVAQVIKTKLVVGAVGHVSIISLLALLVVHAMNDSACGKPQETVNCTHPLCITTGQVIIDRNNMHPS